MNNGVGLNVERRAFDDVFSVIQTMARWASTGRCPNSGHDPSEQGITKDQRSATILEKTPCNGSSQAS
jgi:hypothetical protein